MFQKGFIFAVIFVLSSSSVYGKSLVIEAYGDSLTAGFLSHTNVSAPPTLNSISDILSDLVMFKLTNDYKFLTPYEYPQLAWPEFVAQRNISNGAEVLTKNFAVPGAPTSDFINQVKKVSVDTTPTIAFFYFGHNDISENMDPPEVIVDNFIAGYEKGLHHWDELHKNADAYFISLHHIHETYEVLWDYVWYESSEGIFTCQDSWEKYFPLSLPLYKLAKENKLKEYLFPRVSAMNEAMEHLARTWTNNSHNHNKYHYIDLTEELDLIPEYFAIDCYHLSEIGQKSLADNIILKMTGNK